MSMKLKVLLVLFGPGLLCIPLGHVIGQSAAWVYLAGLLGGLIYLFTAKKKEKKV